jgi:hypothetical protein
MFPSTISEKCLVVSKEATNENIYHIVRDVIYPTLKFDPIN